MFPTRPTILVTCPGTRFHEGQSSSSKEIDVPGLGLAVTSPPLPDSTSKKSKSSNDAREILTDSHLKLKAGVRYGLVGRNGTGKSTLLQAISERLIPGISDTLRIAALQQIDVDSPANSTGDPASPPLAQDGSQPSQNLPSLEYVIQSQMAQDSTLQEFNLLVKAMEGDSGAQLKAFREIKYAQLQRRLDQMRKAADLRSGSRGFKARKELAEFEAQVNEANNRIEQDVLEVDPGELAEEIQAASDLFAALEAQVELMKKEDTQSVARKVLKGLGFNQTRMEQSFRSLSGGWKTRCQLAAVLTKHVDLMLLDEATNYLDLSGIMWLERYVRKISETRGTTIVIVSHDREFINNIGEETIILRDRKLAYFKGNLLAYEEDREARKLDLSRKKDASERQKAHFEQTIAENIRQGKKTGDTNRLSQAKSRRRRVEERTGLQVNSKGFRYKLTRDTGGTVGHKKRYDIVVPTEDRQISMQIPLTTELRNPGALISMENVSHRYGVKSPVILDDIKLSINIGDRIGILGLNGSGKTTLIRLLVREIEPTEGSVTHHPRVKIGYYTQHAIEDLRAQGLLDPSLTALAHLSRTAGASMSEGDVRGLLGSFGLPGELASDVPVSKLSGGQLVRLAFAQIVWDHPHILVLDEISTHLDFDTIAALRDALIDFDGAVVLVSHDRYLLKSLTEEEDDDSDDEDYEFTTNVPRHSAMYLLRRKRLELVQSGMTGIEEQLTKTLKF